MGLDYQRLMRYKHNLRQVYRVKMIGASFDAPSRALVSQDGRTKIQIQSDEKIHLLILGG